MRHTWLALLFCACLLACPAADAGEDAILTRTYARLDGALERKRTQLLTYLGRMQTLADNLGTDRAMNDFFRLKRQYYRALKSGSAPADLQQAMQTLKESVREHYMRNYMAFYDILCVDANGDVFYTVRQEGDYRTNLFAGDLAETALSRRLKSNTQKTFVDYQYYAVSNEPSAFYVQPMQENGELLGWFVLQCTVDKINSMFSREDELGATGEVILVNRQQYMLTDSRFFGETSILRRHLSPKNIQAKFEERTGHKIVTDYRGCRAITSFDVCTIGESQWLMIAKIDEDEVITEEFLRDPAANARLLAALPRPTSTRPEAAPFRGPFTRVDMDEFRRVRADEAIGTYGVSTCTAVVICMPKRFTYMAHLSNHDRVYGMDTTDLIGHMLKRIRDFDIPRAEIRDLRVTLVAPHLKSLLPAVRLLAEKGFLLSQIRFLHRADAEYGTVIHSCAEERTLVEWKVREGERLVIRREDDSAGCSLAQLAGGLLGLAAGPGEVVDRASDPGRD